MYTYIYIKLIHYFDLLTLSPPPEDASNLKSVKILETNICSSLKPVHATSFTFCTLKSFCGFTLACTIIAHVITMATETAVVLMAAPRKRSWGRDAEKAERRSFGPETEVKLQQPTDTLRLGKGWSHICSSCWSTHLGVSQSKQTEPVLGKKKNSWLLRTTQVSHACGLLGSAEVQLLVGGVRGHTQRRRIRRNKTTNSWSKTRKCYLKTHW